MSRFDLSDPGTMRLVVDPRYYLMFDTSNYRVIVGKPSGNSLGADFRFIIRFFG